MNDSQDMSYGPHWAQVWSKIMEKKVMELHGGFWKRLLSSHAKLIRTIEMRVLQ